MPARARGHRGRVPWAGAFAAVGRNSVSTRCGHRSSSGGSRAPTRETGVEKSPCIRADSDIPPENGRARESKALEMPGNSTVYAPDAGGCPGTLAVDSGVLPGTALPDATAAFVEASARLAAAAVARGDRAEACRLLEGALRAVEAAVPSVRLRVVAEAK